MAMAPLRSRFPRASRAVVRSPYPEWMGACLLLMRRNLTQRAPRVRRFAHPMSHGTRLSAAEDRPLHMLGAGIGAIGLGRCGRRVRLTGRGPLALDGLLLLGAEGMAGEARRLG